MCIRDSCYSIPKFCTFNVIIRRIACGEEHSGFITNSGSVYTMGSNTDGRLGINDRSLKLASTPCLVEDLGSFKTVEIACGWGHTAAVLEDGRVFTWGVGDYGALGVPDCTTQWRPAQVSFESSARIRNVSCGTRHTAFIDSKGKLFMCGAGDAGQLGLGSRERKALPIHVSDIRDSVLAAACGIFHTLVLTEGGEVLAMGGNTFGQLGTGSKKSSVHVVAVKGLGGERVSGIAAGHISAAVSETGVVYVWGTGVFGEYLVATPLKGVKKPIKKVVVGGNFGAAIDYNGTLYTWGSNSSGELGMGDYEARPQGSQVTSMQGKCVEDVSCGGSYAIALGRTVPHKYVPPARSAIRNNVQPKMELEKELEMALTQSKVSPISKPEYRASVESELLIQSNEKHRAESQSKCENNVRARAEQKIASPPRVESQYDEMLETYKSEQQRCRNLRRRITEIQRTIQESESRLREATFRDTDKRYLNRLSAVETQLATEQDKCGSLLRELEAERRRAEMVAPEQGTLEAKAGDLEMAAAKLRQENSQMLQDKSPSDNLKVSALLKDYEDRIEQEISDRRRITKEKGVEIRSLQNEVSRNENAITKLQSEKTLLANSYMEEIQRLETHVNEQKRLLDIKMLEKEDLLDLKNKDIASIEITENNIRKVNSDILDIEQQLKDALSKLESVRQKVLQLEEDVERANEENAKCRSFIEQKEAEYSNNVAEGKDSDAKNIEELKQLEAILEEKDLFNEELREGLICRVAEIEGLSKNVEACTDVANRSRTENTSLKRTIEELEAKNKKLMESMNLHMYNRAAEYKQRTINALKASQLPNRIDKLRSSGYGLRHVTPSPERFEKFMEEEKKSTSKGVDNVVHLTRFKAETVESIKNKRQGLRRELKTPESNKQFDGKFVVDQVDYGVEEDPQFVKSNYVLVQMLDHYKQPVGQQKLLEERKEVYTASEASQQVAQSSQGFSLTSLEHTNEVFATPGEAKLKVSVCVL
eukprot:TRINITY_DN10942_c0_g1_i2.p1 TRINITY_DN10942_c0_g1~~TRINITY_DN10942_c0_g1_i2.p1  ORF type:complete len:992 (+),score=296.82 TRINITY_DN10942_c0_g1_i2:74-3049(+)